MNEKKEYIKKDVKDFKSDEPIVFVNPKFDVPKHLKDSDGSQESPTKKKECEKKQKELIKKYECSKCPYYLETYEGKKECYYLECIQERD